MLWKETKKERWKGLTNRKSLNKIEWNLVELILIKETSFKNGKELLEIIGRPKLFMKFIEFVIIFLKDNLLLFEEELNEKW